MKLATVPGSRTRAGDRSVALTGLSVLVPGRTVIVAWPVLRMRLPIDCTDDELLLPRYSRVPPFRVTGALPRYDGLLPAELSSRKSVPLVLMVTPELPASEAAVP